VTNTTVDEWETDNDDGKWDESEWEEHDEKQGDQHWETEEA
jgi:hypothetical protein